MAAVARDRSLAAEAVSKCLVAVAEALHNAAVTIELDRLAAPFVPESVRVAGAVGGGPETADVVGDVPVGTVAAERIADPAGAVIESWRTDPDLVERRRGRILARAAGDEEADLERPLSRKLAAAGVAQRAPELSVRRLRDSKIAADSSELEPQWRRLADGDAALGMEHLPVAGACRIADHPLESVVALLRVMETKRQRGNRAGGACAAADHDAGAGMVGPLEEFGPLEGRQPGDDLHVAA